MVVCSLDWWSGGGGRMSLWVGRGGLCSRGGGGDGYGLGSRRRGRDLVVDCRK